MKKLLLLLAMSLALAGCGASNSTASGEGATGDQGSSTTYEESQDFRVPSATFSSVKMRIWDAASIFAEKFPSVDIDEISFEIGDGLGYYEVHGFDKENEYELKLRADDGGIISEETEKEDTTGKKALDRDLLEDLYTVLDNAVADAGEDYFVKSYHVDYEDNGSFMKLEIELENTKGQDIEYEYNLSTQELLQKDR